MLKSALRLHHTTKLKNNSLVSNHDYTALHLTGAIIDEAEIKNAKFTHFLFADCGMKKVKFVNCEFRDTVFAGCYLKEAVFENCKIIGCHFEICTTTGLKLEKTEVEHVDFFRCVLPYQQLKKSLGTKYAINDKMMLNCATEAHRTGQWRDAGKFLARHHVEKRKFWIKMITSRSGFYSRYNVFQRARAAFRLAISFTMKIIFGDSPSIISMILLGAVLSFIIFPTSIMLLDSGETALFRDTIPKAIGTIIFYLQNYWSYFVKFFNLMLGLNIQAKYDPDIGHIEAIEITSRIIGVVYLSVLSNIATKSLTGGPTW